SARDPLPGRTAVPRGEVAILVSTPEETYRATMQVQTPEDGPATLIITQQGLGCGARMWLTLNGSIRATAVLDAQDVSQLASKLQMESGTDERTQHRVTSTGDTDRAR
ncbi:MAG: hypothetical protein ACRDRA_09930, partial [Pseudonocardiaceae bacterium]